MSLSASPLEFQRLTWTSLIADLRQRGEGKRESGAFLLGSVRTHCREVQDWVPYAELDPNSLHYDYVRLESQAFSRLWAICAERRLDVVADVHTHPGAPIQSFSDRANPMISTPGHVALIVPRFAIGQVLPSSVSVNVYLGGKKWKNYLGQDAGSLIRLK